MNTTKTQKLNELDKAILEPGVQERMIEIFNEDPIKLKPFLRKEIHTSEEAVAEMIYHTALEPLGW